LFFRENWRLSALANGGEDAWGAKSRFFLSHQTEPIVLITAVLQGRQLEVWEAFSFRPENPWFGETFENNDDHVLLFSG
jgi:hypothetical protein